MRAELILILWVTAAAPLIYANFHGESPSGVVSSSSDSAISGKATVSQQPGGKVNNSSGQSRRALPEIDVSARPIFRVAALVVVPKNVVRVTSVPPSQPVLKGIIQRSGVNLAVFLPTSASPQYVVVGGGDVVGDYRIIAVMSDSVSVVKVSDRSAVILKLQGAGELP